MTMKACHQRCPLSPLPLVVRRRRRRKSGVREREERDAQHHFIGEREERDAPIFLSHGEHSHLLSK
jgi:hypothetical protein